MAQFLALLWKNLHYRRRTYITVALELFFPILLFWLIADIAGSSADDSPKDHDEQIFNSVTKDEIMTEYLWIPFDLVFTPNNSLTFQIMTNIKPHLKTTRFVAVDNENAMVDWFRNSYKENNSYRYGFGVVFNQDQLSQGILNISLRSTINYQEWNTNLKFPAFQIPGPMFTEDANIYFKGMFVPLQILINDAFLNLTSDNRPVNFNMTEFPYPAYTSSNAFITIFTALIPNFTLFGYISAVASLVKKSLEEKMSGTKEYLKMMGVKEWLLYIDLIMHNFLLSFWSTLIVTIILKTPYSGLSILPNSNFLLIWFLFLIFCFQGVSFVSALSSMFTNPSLGISVNITVWLLSYFTLSWVNQNVTLSFFGKCVTVLAPGMGLLFGFGAIGNLEAKGVGLQFSNLFESASGDYWDTSYGNTVLTMIVYFVFYSLLYFYVTAVRPGPYGSPKPWHFVFTFMFQKKARVEASAPKSEAVLEQVDTPVAISIRDITKVYPKNVAVNHLYLDIYEGQITALLGHNGAGKTTLMSMLSGMIHPSGGEVYVNGEPVLTKSKKFKNMIGLCPQHNLLYDYLTVEQHLTFVGILRGLSWKDIGKASKELTDQFLLTKKRNTLVSDLSGGMKRKLCLSMALIGNPKILLLDEPSSGLDPEFRREVWDILLNLRGNKVLIISTHFMEEADALGDMIAIMDHGEIKCYGTGMFLKKHYGTGYLLKIDAPLSSESYIRKIVMGSVPSAKSVPKSKYASFVFNLPSTETSKFPKMFEALEEHNEISNIGLSCSTMEDVFMRAGGITDDMLTQGVNDFNGSHGTIRRELEKVKGLRLTLQQAYALIMKKLHWTISCLFGVIYYILFWPAILLLIAITITSALALVFSPMPSLKLDLDAYDNTDVLVKGPVPANPALDKYQRLVKDTGSTCTLTQNDIVQELLNKAKEDITHFRSKMIVAHDLNSPNSLYSSVAYHGAPIAVNLMYNTFMTNGSVITYNHPMPTGDQGCFKAQGMAITLSMFVVMALQTAIGSFLRFPHGERTSGGKHIQFMSGLPPLLYWLCSFIFDFLIYLVTVALVMVIFGWVDRLHIVRRPFHLEMFLALMMLAGVNNIWFNYFFTFFFDNFTTGFAIYNIASFTGISIRMVIFTISSMKLVDPDGWILIIHYLFMLDPPYVVMSVFLKFFIVCSTVARCEICTESADAQECASVKQDDFYAWSRDYGINEDLVFLACLWFGYLIIIMLAEAGVFQTAFDKIKSRVIGPPESPSPYLDEDVVLERAKVDGLSKVGGLTSNGCPAVVAKNLTKKYNKQLTAVKGVSLAIPDGECFGLLGINGAGKSTTFKMLTAEIFPTDGDAFILGNSLKKDKIDYLSRIGYNPQADPLIEDLTGMQHLQYYARIRGVSPKDMSFAVQQWIDLLGFDEHKFKKSKEYSGGTKRKLSIAMSLVGDPGVVFLDEPTSGVDPIARRKLWNVLAMSKASGQTVVITSHSMDECEAVCDRLTIMAQGELRCMGTIPHIKTKYGQGFTIMIKVNIKKLRRVSSVSMASIKDDVSSLLGPQCQLKDEHGGLLHYHLVDHAFTWASVFSAMESFKRKHPYIDDYEVTETSLEQIFISFAKQYQGAKTIS